MKPSQILIGAKSLINTPSKWTQGKLATTSEGWSIGFEAPSATCFCSVGALRRFILEHNIKDIPFEVSTYFEKAIEQIHPGYVVPLWTYNDAHGWIQVMKVWDLAIELAMKDENEQQSIPT